MKKKLLLTVLVMATLFTSCKNESENNNGVDNGTKADTEIAKTAEYGVELDDKEKIPAGDESDIATHSYFITASVDHFLHHALPQVAQQPELLHDVRLHALTHP